jgi:hypothetical protein
MPRKSIFAKQPFNLSSPATLKKVVVPRKSSPKTYKSAETKQRSVKNLKRNTRKDIEKMHQANSVSTYRQSLAEHIRTIGEEEIEGIDPKTGEVIKWRRIDAVVRRVYADALGGKSAAQELIFERGWGKVPTPVQIDLKTEVIQIIQQTGLSLQEAAKDPILGAIAESAGIIVDGKFVEDSQLALPEPAKV